MAHASGCNGAHTSGTHKAPRYLLKKQHRHRGFRSSSPMGRVILINSPVDGGDESEDIHTITVDKSADGKLGFSVRGGSEHGLSIFVSKVEDESTAEQAGLCVGDKLVEVNGVSLESITMSSAVKVLTGNNRLRMVVRRVGKVPGIRYSKEKTTWIDLIHRRMVVEESGRTPSETSSDGGMRRIVHLYTTSDDYCLGFNIRGGKEFGLGIYVSKLDQGGLAEINGIKIGDQILAANGISFEDISHSHAVEVLKSHTHIMLTIKETGRYPAFKEMVAEYSWLNKLASIPKKSSSQGSDTSSSASSLSSGTPISSLSGLSQIMFPPNIPAFGMDMVDVSISSEEPDPSSYKTEMAIQTDPLEPESSSKSTAGVALDTSRTLGSTELLRDTAIRTREKRSRSRSRASSTGEPSLEDHDSPKTAVLMALSKPRRPLRRSQSHITLSEDKKKRKKQKTKGAWGGSTLQRSKTFVSLLFKGGRKRETSREKKESGVRKSLSKSPYRSDAERGRERGPFSGLEVLDAVEDMAMRLLAEDEVLAVMRHCRRFLMEHVLEELVRPLLVLLDRPEKLLLLREIRMLIPPADLRHFDSMVAPYETEAYDILKSRSVRSPALRSPKAGSAPKRHLVTPVLDYRGGFHLQPALDVERERHLMEELSKLQVSNSQTQASSRTLLDIQLDGYTSNYNPTVPMPTNTCGSGASQPERGRSPLRKGHKNAQELSSPTRRIRPSLPQVFAPSTDTRHTNREGSDTPPKDCVLTTVSVSKTKQSLGISISGGIESKVQPVVKIEKIFPGGAASANEVLKAGFELLSVDGESLQGVTHQHAVDLIRKAFSNKAKDPMVFVVRVPKGPSIM